MNNQNHESHIRHNEPVHTPAGGPPSEGPSREIYAALGADNLFRMCADFYVELERSPIRPMFPEDMPAASRKLAMFLSGLTGGPALYMENYGPPMMRKRHLPFLITPRERDAWLSAFLKVLEQAPENYGFPAEHLPAFIRFLEGFADWMVNAESASEA